MKKTRPEIDGPVNHSGNSEDSGPPFHQTTVPMHLAPRRIIAYMAVTVFGCEVLVMKLLSRLPEIQPWYEAFLDATLLTLLLTPSFYFFLYRPFRKHLVERQLNEEKIRQMAFYDHITGLPNRLLFHDRLNQTLARSERPGSLLAVAFCDLDNFKQVNDRLGHDTGDKLLNLMGQRLRENLRQSDTVARLGGDEFVFLLSEYRDEEDVLLVLRRLSQAIKVPCIIAGQEISLSASIGVSLYPDDGDDGEALLRKADQAMYLVKRGGRDGILFHKETCQSSNAGTGHGYGALSSQL